MVDFETPPRCFFEGCVSWWIQERDPLITEVTFWVGVRYGHCSRAVTRGLEMCALDGVNTGSLPGFGCESFVVVRYTGFVDGDCPGNLSLGQITGDGSLGNLMGRRFWVGPDVDVFFLGGTPGRVMLRRFHRTTRVPNNPVCMLHIIC